MTTVKEPAATANQHRLNAIDGETLMTTPLPPIHFTIGGLLPQGLHILAGAPKAGKSWLALWLCLCVAKGEAVWEFPSARGDVLYLCLEDSYSRIQNRLLDITDEAPDNLFFATMSKKLRCGLEQQIERFLAEHPGTALIVIDTLQRIRSIANDVNSYANDYRDLGILKELADKHRIAILLIHHLRKMNDDDPHERVVADCVSFASVQARKFTRFVAPPFSVKPASLGFARRYAIFTAPGGTLSTGS